MFSLEPPWKNNEPLASCIPVGEYELTPFLSEKHGETYKLVDVPGRSDIEFHPGNWVKNTSGCILVGSTYETYEDGKVVLVSSKAAFLQLIKEIESNKVTKIRILNG